MQISLKTVAAAVALAIAATPAIAVESTTSGNSTMFVTVFDPVLGASVVQDLGINYADFLRSAVTPDTGYSRSFNVDMSVFTQVGSYLSDLQYSVYAGDIKALEDGLATVSVNAAAPRKGGGGHMDLLLLLCWASLRGAGTAASGVECNGLICRGSRLALSSRDRSANREPR